MNSDRYPDGSGLEELYMRDKSHEDLQNPDNLKTLLDYILNKNTGDLTNSDLEIIEYCNEVLFRDDPVDEEKLQFLGDKYALIGKEDTKRRRNRMLLQMAACLVVVFFGAAFVVMSGTESEAGIFDWVRSLFVEEEAEDLVMSSPESVNKIHELKEGHLPNNMPDQYRFVEAQCDDFAHGKQYLYHFVNNSNTSVMIRIFEYNDTTVLFNVMNEIIDASSETKDINYTTYYYTENYDTSDISWIQECTLYKIFGPCSFSELEEIISCYQETKQ